MILNSSYNWIDNSSSDNLNLGDDDCVERDLPFSFPFYENNYDKINISSNGLVSFYTNYTYYPSSFPSTDYKRTIAVFAADLVPYSFNQIYVKSIASPNRYVIIYKNLTYLDDVTITGTYEIVLFDNGSIKLQYKNIYNYFLYYGGYCGVNRGEGDNYYNFYNNFNNSITDYAINFYYPPNDNAPQLTSGQVNPSSGNQSVLYTYTVNYTDADNNPPTYVNVSINDTYYLMSKQNPSDNNYTDGCIYEFSTYLQPGNYNYSFGCWDGGFYVTTTTEDYPTVSKTNNALPSLDSPQVYPESGYVNLTIFNFSVIYSDPDNNAPESINITLDGEIFAMSQVDPSDMNYMDGSTFHHLSTLSDLGSHQYEFKCFDGTYSASRGPYSNPFVKNITNYHNLTFANFKVGAVVGYGGNNPFEEYPIVKQDLEARGAQFSIIEEPLSLEILYEHDLIWFDDFGNSLPTNHIEDLYNWVDGGGTLLITGENRMGQKVDIVQRFNLDYTQKDYVDYDGITTDITPHPITMNVDQFRVNNPDYFVNISSQPHATSLIRVDGYDLAVALEQGQGAIALINHRDSLGNYIYAADNRLLANNTFGWLYSLVYSNSFEANLTSGDVNPKTGNQSTLVTYTVTYTDGDNNRPVYLNVFINGTAYAMWKQDPLDNDMKDGCLYEYHTYLQPGSYNYSFEGFDGEFYNSTITYFDPTITETNLEEPDLISGQVQPSTGYENLTLFDYTVNYSDPDNNAPQYLTITLDGISQDTNKLDPSDVNYMDGCIYGYLTNLSGVGYHQYSFSCSDGIFQTAKGPYEQPYVKKIYNYSDIALTNFKVGAVLSYGGVNPFVKLTNLTGDLKCRGAELFNITDPLNSTVLSNYDLVWVDDFGSSLPTEDLEDLYEWVNNGGSILITGYVGKWQKASILQMFNLDFIEDFTSYTGYVTDITAHPVTQNISQFYTMSPQFFVDTSSQLNATSLIRVEEYNLAVSLEQSNGAIVIVNDDLCFTDNLDEGDNYLLANNTFGWLYSINASDQYKPALFDGDVNPKTGNQSTLITYTVNYTDPDNNGPREINVVINGSSYAMWKQDIQDYNFTDGCIYEFSTYLLHPGLYNYSFNCFDGKYTNETSTYWNPTVSYTNEDPLALTDGAVEPLEGEAGITTFYFTVNYTDSDNNFLVSINITLDGVNYTMTQVDPSDVNYMDGCLFFYSTKLGGITTHEFNFTAFDGIYYDFDGTFNNPKTNDTTGPLIDNITASPLVGDQGTIFNFTVDLWDYSGIYSALGYITYLNDTFIETITFWDDGNHNDGGNGDGIFGASWDSSGFSQGVYLLDINATDSMIYHYESLYENFTFGIVNWACQAGMEYRWNMTSVPFGPEMTGFHIIYNVSEITITSALMSFVMGNIALYNFTSAQIIGYTNKIELENYNLTTQLFSQPSLPGLPFPQLTLPFLVVPFDLEKVNDSIINFRSYPANANFSLYYENNTIMYEYSMYGYTYVEVYQWNDLGMMNRTILFINNLLYLQYDYLGPDEAPPNLEYVEILPEIEVEGTPFNITAKVVDYWGVKNVSAIITYPDFSTDVMIMYDDGNHNDGFNGDGIFGASWDSTGKSPDVYNVSINATDINGFWKYFDNVANFTVTATDISSPLVLDSNVAPLIVAVNENGIFNITAYVWDPSGISSVIATIKYSNNTIIENVTMYDDGAHNDGFAGDWVFGGNWSTNSYPKGIYYLDIFCNDSDANEKVYINETEFVIVNWTVSSGDVYVYNVTYNDFPFGALAPFYVFPAGYLFRVDVKDINSTFVSYPGPDDFVLRFWGDIYELNETAYWTQLAALDYIIDANITLNYYVSNILNVVGIPIFPSFLPTPIRLTTLMWLTQTNIFYSGYPPSMISYTYNETSLHMKLQLVYDLKLTYTAKGVLIKYEFIYLGYRFVVELILDEKNEDNGQLVDPTFTLLDENTGDFTVNYYNTKGIYPLNVTININGTSYLMNQIDPSDFNYIDGATYRLTHPITWGNYYNYFITYFDGNYSHSTTPTIIRAIDLTPPQNTSIIINSGDYYTTNSLVTLTLNATDVIEMRFKNETGMWSDWEAYNITKKCYLSEGYGSKTIWVVFRDKYSNEADAISDTIVKLGPNGVFLKSSGINVINKSDLGIYVEIETTQVGFMDVRKLTADELNITRPWTNFTAVYYFSFEVYDTDYILSSDIVINATVRIYYNPFVIGNVDNLHLLKYVGNDTWESIEFTINREEYYIEFNTSSFSIYSLGEIPPLFDPFLIIAIVIAIISIISFSLVSFVVVKKKQKKKVPSIRSKKTIKTPFWVSEEEQALKPIPKKKAESELIAKEERTPEEIAELEKTEKEIGIEKEKFMCIVHRGKIVGNIYVCPNCQAIYCQNCAKSLKQKGESCWSCENEIEIDLFESEAKNNDEM